MNLRKLLYILTFTICGFLSAQIDSMDNSIKKYILKDLEIKGATKFNKNQILRYTGLSLNEEVELPGQKINSAIKKLWRSNLFSDVELFVKSIEGNDITLSINLVPLKDLGKVTINGIPKGKQDKFKKDNGIKDGIKITENLKNKFQTYVHNYYSDKGYPNSKTTFKEVSNTENPSQVDWIINIDKGPRVKIKSIEIDNNKELSDSRLRVNGLKNTRRKNIIRFWKASKFNQDKYNQDLNTLIEEYRSLGFRDAKVVEQKVSNIDEKSIGIKLNISEGIRYHIGNINFIGNSVYSTDFLSRVLSYKKGDIYDAVGVQSKISGSQKDDDINTLYQNEGYLFSNVRLLEKSVRKDSIDLDVVINEGSKATFDKVTFSGNYNTYDHVIQRSLRTLPGELFSKADIKRTYADLASMPYIEAQHISPDVKPNPENNTVNIHWNLAEKGASQVQLQGGYGAGRFIGTLGLSFGNFSLRNLFTKGRWKPIPVGDGQTLSLQAQAGSNYQNYSVSFVEPWIGGKKPTSLSVSFYNTILNSSTTSGASSNLNILGANVGLNKLLSWPDNWFRLSQVVTYQVYRFTNYPFNFGTILLNNGSSNNLNYNISLSRNSQAFDPIFPTQGSEFDLSVKLTPPYSLFGKKDYSALSNEEKYKWIEYYKIKFKAFWYQELLGKSVIKIGGEFGFLKGYNSDLGAPPFERFFMGGTGLLGNRFDGREIIPLRGYQDATNTGGQVGTDLTPSGGGTIYNKFLLELRYPITLGQTAKIYALSFFEAGNTWDQPKLYKPFELKRSAGVGIRVFMPAFGLLGFDFGYGFDKAINANQKSGWQSHFIIGQQF